MSGPGRIHTTRTFAGITLIGAQAMLFSWEAVAIHQIGPGADLMGLAFLRGLGGALLVMGLAKGRPEWRIESPKLMLLRCIIFAASIWVYIAVYRALPLANVASIYYLDGIFWSIYGAIFLRESLGRQQWIVVVSGFLATLLIVKPVYGPLGWLYAMAVAGAALNAAALPLSRQLSRYDAPLTIMLYVSCAGMLASFPGAFVRSIPELSPWLLGVAVLGPLGQYCGILAVRYSDLTALASFGYIRLPLTLALGVVLFNEVPDYFSLLGMMVILAGCGWLAIIPSMEGGDEART